MKTFKNIMDYCDYKDFTVYGSIKNKYSFHFYKIGNKLYICPQWTDYRKFVLETTWDNIPIEDIIKTIHFGNEIKTKHSDWNVEVKFKYIRLEIVYDKYINTDIRVPYKMVNEILNYIKNIDYKGENNNNDKN